MSCGAGPASAKSCCTSASRRSEYIRSAWRPPSPRSAAAMSSLRAAWNRSRLPVLASSTRCSRCAVRCAGVFEGPLEILGEGELVGVGQLVVSLFQMEDVDGFVALGRDQHELDAQTVLRDDAA